MWGEIIIGVCTAAAALIGSIGGHRLTAYRVQRLEQKVEEHNGYARRMPVVEEQIKVINHRLSDLERG